MIMNKLKIGVLLLVLISLTTYSCLDSELDATYQSSGFTLKYYGPGFDPSALTNDEFKIIAVIPGDDVWQMIIQYTGGCAEHDFATYWDGTSESSTSSFYIFHDSNSDECKATVRDTLELETAGIFPDLNLTSIDVKAINSSNGRTILLKSDLRAITQGDKCTLNASTQETTCAESIWGNTWMLLNDSVSSSGAVWFQPVKDSSSHEDITTGTDYQLGVTLLFGYQYVTGVECSATPDGNIVPVAINCLSKL